MRTSARSLRPLLAATVVAGLLVPATTGHAAARCSVRGQIVGRPAGWTTIRQPAFTTSNATGRYLSQDKPGSVDTDTAGGGNTALGLAVDPYDGRRMYAHNGKTIMRSTDGGCRWRTVFTLSSPEDLGLDNPSDPGAYIRQLSIPPHRSARARLYAVVQGATPTIYRSNDGGTTWSSAPVPVTAGRTTALPMETLYGPEMLPSKKVVVAVAPSNPDVLYVKGSGGAYFRSADGGASWTEQVPLPDASTDDDTAGSGTGLTVDPYDPDVLYESVPVRESQRRNYFRVSRNAGRTWTKVALPVSLSSGETGTAVSVVGLRGKTRVYVAWLDGGNQVAGLYLSDDGGRTLSTGTSPGHVGCAGYPYSPAVVQGTNPDDLVVIGHRAVLLVSGSKLKARRSGACRLLPRKHGGPGEDGTIAFAASTQSGRRSFYILERPTDPSVGPQELTGGPSTTPSPGTIEVYTGSA